MSFIDHYLKEYNLDELPASSKKRLEKLEDEIKDKVDFNPTKSTFDDVVTKYGSQIADIVERFAKHFKDIDGWSIGTIWGSLRFVINIGVEVKQLVMLMKDDIVTDDMTPEEQKVALSDFAKDLIWFIWKTVDPLRNRLGWLPFKQKIEKWLVMKIADMAVDFAGDLIDRHFGPMEAGDISIKVL